MPAENNVESQARKRSLDVVIQGEGSSSDPIELVLPMEKQPKFGSGSPMEKQPKFDDSE